VVAVAITALDQQAVLVRDALHRSLLGLNVEAACFPNSDTARMDAGLLAGGHDGFHHITLAASATAMELAWWMPAVIERRGLDWGA